MKIRPPDDSDSATASDAMRVALDRQLGDTARSGSFEAPPPIPDHTLLHRIGRGAYGDVWLARNALGTLRAVKIVYRAHFDEDRPYEREFKGILSYEPISRTHEGLVQVLHVGRNDEAKCFYYVMEAADPVISNQCPVISGTEPVRNSNQPPLITESLINDYSPRTLRSDLARHQRLPPTNAAQLALQLAEALGHLHSHGLVHRDIKPSNVIFVGGQPKLADIGLVTSAGDSRSFVGTEGFVPPEGPGTPPADLYSLGKLLYELATGHDRMDFPQLPLLSLTLSASDGEREPVRGREAEDILELNEVITRACAPQPQDRYASAAELQADLNLFLAGRSLRRVRNVERHVALFKRIAVVACGFLAIAAAVIWFALHEQRRANDRASAEAALRSRAEQAERERTAQLYTALLGEARAVVRSGELGQRVKALDALRRAAAISNTAELRREVITALALPDLRFERELPIDREATFVELDPTFECYAICRGSGPVEIRAVSGNRLLTSLPPGTNFPVYYGKWSPDGKYLAFKRDRVAFGVRAAIEVWEVADSRRVLFVPDVPTGAMAFHPRRPWLIANGEEGITIWNLEGGQQLKSFDLPRQANVRLQFSPDGECFAALNAGERLKAAVIYNAIDGSRIAIHEFLEVPLEMDWHPSGRWLATVDQSGAVLLMDSQSGETRLLGQHKAEAARAAFSPDGRYLITGGWERELICWDTRTMQRAFNMALGGYQPRFRADGRQVAVIIETPRRVLLHAFELPAAHREIAEDLGPRVRSAAFSADGRWLAASGAERFGVWELTSSAPGVTGKLDGGSQVSFSKSCEVFVQRPGECSRWRIMPAADGAGRPGLEQLEFAVPPGFTSLSHLSNSVVLTGTNGSQIAALNPQRGQSSGWKYTAPGRTTVSPDGRWLAVHPSYRRELGIYHLPDLELAAVLTNTFPIAGFEFSPWADEIAAGSRHGIEFWNTTTWQRTRVVTNFTDILYSPDGRSLWLTKDFNIAGLYDAVTLQPLLPLPNGVLPLAVSPDSRWLAVSVDMRRLQVWDLEEVRKQLRKLGLDWPDQKELTADRR